MTMVSVAAGAMADPTQEAVSFSPQRLGGIDGSSAPQRREVVGVRYLELRGRNALEGRQEGKGWRRPSIPSARVRSLFPPAYLEIGDQTSVEMARGTLLS